MIIILEASNNGKTGLQEIAGIMAFFSTKEAKTRLTLIRNSDPCCEVSAWYGLGQFLFDVRVMPFGHDAAYRF